MKTYYELLEVAPAASAEEIKRAFRREIARYHPDKVQHLGPEFQAIASSRAAELTEAYRILMDEGARQQYDEGLGAGAAPPAPGPAAPAARPAAPAPSPFEAPPPDRRFQQERATTNDFVRKAVFAKLREAVGAVSQGASVTSAPGLDAVYLLKGKAGLFRKTEPQTRVLAKYVPVVDRAALEDTWPSAASQMQAGETVCLLLLGSGLAPVQELSSAVADLRRKARKAGPIVVPVDVRDWDALFPPEAPAPVRAVLQRLRAGEA
ncbi:MAG TPA: J domain-containing protein [Vicinamibacterales bacterium]